MDCIDAGMSTVDRGILSRRRLLQSGAGFATAGYIAATAIDTVSAQSDDPWPAQGFDPENTRHSQNTTPLRDNPGVLAREEISPGAHADYTVTGRTAFIHSGGNGIGAIDTETGDLFWQANVGETPVIPEGIDGDTLLTRELDGTIRIISIDDGSQVAEIPLDQGYSLGYNGQKQWVAPISDGRIVSGETGSSAINWETSVEGIGVRPAVTDNQVFVSTVQTSLEEFQPQDPTGMDAEGRLYALDITDGTVLWDTERVGAGMAAPLVRDGVVYWAGTDGDILAYNTETGEGVWEFKTNGSFPRSPVAAGGMILAGSQDGSLYAIDADSGEQLNRIPVGAPISTSPVAVEEVIYLGTSEGSVHAYEYDGGEHVWEFEADAAVWSLTVSNGLVIAGTEAGYYVLTDEESAEGSTNTGTTAQSSGGDDESGSEATPGQRGLFSNDGNEPDALSNPFNLTTLGFLLLVAGIIYQMFQGR